MENCNRLNIEAEWCESVYLVTIGFNNRLSPVRCLGLFQINDGLLLTQHPNPLKKATWSVVIVLYQSNLVSLEVVQWINDYIAHTTMKATIAICS